MNFRHGMRRTKVYGVWCSMLSRCRNPANAAWANYGGRGIAVCERWEDFTLFLADMGSPGPGQSLDRIDNDRGYGPENCRWADRSTQGQNKRNNRLLSVGDLTLTMSAWADRSGLNIGTIHARLKKGWPVDAAVTTPTITSRRGIRTLKGSRLYAFGAREGVAFEPREQAA